MNVHIFSMLLSPSIFHVFVSIYSAYNRSMHVIHFEVTIKVLRVSNDCTCFDGTTFTCKFGKLKSTVSEQKYSSVQKKAAFHA